MGYESGGYSPEWDPFTPAPEGWEPGGGIGGDGGPSLEEQRKGMVSVSPIYAKQHPEAVTKIGEHYYRVGTTPEEMEKGRGLGETTTETFTRVAQEREAEKARQAQIEEMQIQYQAVQKEAEKLRQERIETLYPKGEDVTLQKAWERLPQEMVAKLQVGLSKEDVLRQESSALNEWLSQARSREGLIPSGLEVLKAAPALRPYIKSVKPGLGQTFTIDIPAALSGGVSPEALELFVGDRSKIAKAQEWITGQKAYEEELAKYKEGLAKRETALGAVSPYYISEEVMAPGVYGPPTPGGYNLGAILAAEKMGIIPVGTAISLFAPEQISEVKRQLEEAPIPPTTEVTRPIGQQAFIDMYYTERGWEHPHRGIATSEELKLETGRLREASSVYEKKYGVGEVLKSGGIKLLSTVVGPARVLYPEVTKEQIGLGEMILGGIQVAGLTLPVWAPLVSKVAGMAFAPLRRVPGLGRVVPVKPIAPAKISEMMYGGPKEWGEVWKAKPTMTAADIEAMMRTKPMTPAELERLYWMAEWEQKMGMGGVAFEQLVDRPSIVATLGKVMPLTEVVIAPKVAPWPVIPIPITPSFPITIPEVVPPSREAPRRPLVVFPYPGVSPVAIPVPFEIPSPTPWVVPSPFPIPSVGPGPSPVPVPSPTPLWTPAPAPVPGPTPVPSPMPFPTPIFEMPPVPPTPPITKGPPSVPFKWPKFPKLEGGGFVGLGRPFGGLFGEKGWVFPELTVSFPEPFTIGRREVTIAKERKVPYGAKRIGRRVEPGTRIVKGIRI